MTDSSQAVETALRRHGYSLTKPRTLVFSTLQHQEPQTMHDIVLACAGQIDRASVYRTIALFESLGIVQRLQIGWKYKLELSDDFHDHHHHLTCLECGRTIPLPEDSLLEQRLLTLAGEASFTMRGHQLEIQGYCQTCQPNH